MNRADQHRVSAHFKRSIATYDREAKVQREVGAALVRALDHHPDICFDRVLEVGCCTGSMTEMLCSARSVRELWLNDLVQECTLHAFDRVRHHVTVLHVLHGDIEEIEMPADLDLIISTSTFQWLENLSSAFERFFSALKPEGFLAFSMFGSGTMRQIHDLLKIGLCYRDGNEIRSMLSERFEVEHLEVIPYTIYFTSPREVLRHIQKTGVGGVSDFRWTPATLRSFESRYRTQYENGAGVPLDYISINVIARKR